MVAASFAEPRATSAVPPALPFALFAGLAVFALAAFSPAILNDGDTYWHIRAGEWMLARGTVLHADPFSYTAAGAPWDTQEWLAEIFMALAWRLGAWAGVHLLTAACAGMAAGITAWFVRKRMETVPALLTVVLGLSLITASLLARPHILALPLLAAWSAGLVTAREHGQAPSWWLLLLMPLWANLHGSFAFGLALTGALGVEAVMESPDRKRAALTWGAFLVAAILSALLTPEGVHGLLFPLKLSAMHGIAHIGEWQATDFTRPNPLEFALLAALFVLATGKVRLPLLRALIVLGLVHLALSHARHQMLLGVTGTLLLTPALAAAWPAKDEDAKPLFAMLAAFGLVVTITLRLMLPAVRGDDAITPTAALAHVPPALRALPVLNDYVYGGFLIWNGVRPFIDSRADLYGDSFLANYSDIIAPDPDALASTLAYYHVRWTIFPAGSPVVREMDRAPGWHRLYGDNFAVVHIRGGG